MHINVRAVTIAILMLMAILSSCGNDKTENMVVTGASQDETFRSEKLNGRWTTDRSTAMELRAMQSTMVNFNMMIKKQPQNLAAYQEYGNVLLNHIDRTVTYCSLDKNTRSLLCKDLDKIKEQIATLQKGNITEAREAAKTINSLFNEIDASFNFDY